LEAFGLTVLEAMGLGTPVVASNAASLPEVLGNGGIIVEHGDAGELAQAMWRIATDDQLQSKMRERGFNRVANFSWIACAAETARAYQKLLQARQSNPR
jgi:glycosyltransferase involved in cell wall biosynthesis